MNVDKHISTEIAGIIREQLPTFNQLNMIEDSTWDKQGKFPYIYIYMPEEVDASFHYEDNSSLDSKQTISILAYIGFKAPTDVLKQGLSQEVYWELANQVKKGFRGMILTDYEDTDETVKFDPIKYAGKYTINPNNGAGVGLGVVQFQLTAKVSVL